MHIMFTFMHCDTCDICVVVRLVTCVLSTLPYICHVTCLCSFALLLHYTLIQMSFTFCTRAYFISCEYIMLAWVNKHV
jgi:hypothetical protein